MKKRCSTTEPLSINALSAKTKIDRRTIAKRLVDVPPAGGTPTAPKWTLKQLESATAKAAEQKPSADLKQQKLTEEVRKLKLHNDENEGLLVDKSAVIAAVQRGGSSWNSERLRFEAELPAKLVGIVSVPEMAGKVKEVMDEVTRILNALKRELETI